MLTGCLLLQAVLTSKLDLLLKSKCYVVFMVKNYRIKPDKIYAFVGLVYRDTDVNASCVHGNECAYTQVKRLGCIHKLNYTP